jgi:hypothetical protein
MTEQIIIIDATPAMAEIVSGAVCEPKPFPAGGNIWEWLPQTPACRKMFGAEILKNDTYERRVFEPGLYASQKIDTSGEFMHFIDETTALRVVSPGQGIYLTAIKRYRDGSYDYADAYLFAPLNPEGTRAAFIPVIHPHAAWSAPERKSTGEPGTCARCGAPANWISGAGEYLCFRHDGDY